MKARLADDVGTRLQHLMDLQDAWSTALALLTRPKSWHSPQEKLIAEKLKVALDLLTTQMRAEFSDVAYAKEINALPKRVEDIT